MKFITPIILILVLASCKKYELDVTQVDDDIYRYNNYSNYNTNNLVDINKYPYNDQWKMVGGYIALEMDSLAWGETFDTIHFDSTKQALYINTYLNIDSAHLGMVWDIKSTTITANNVIYNYNFLDYSNTVDVNTTPSKRSYQIVMIDDNNMVVIAPKQYVDNMQALQTRECVLEFERL